MKCIGWIFALISLLALAYCSYYATTLNQLVPQIEFWRAFAVTSFFGPLAAFMFENRKSKK